MNKHIEKNKEGIKSNKQSIRENEKKIQENKSEIDKMREEHRWHAEADKARFERIIHRVITALIVAIVLIVITNAFWIYAWNRENGISILNKDGTTNFIGHDGSIKEGD